jgi:hypothetical protein
LKHFAHGTPLNQPWDFALAPANFGTLSSTLLVSNNTSAAPSTLSIAAPVNSLAPLTNTLGKPLAISRLWGIEFGGGTSSNGLKNQLFFTAGPKDTDGFFGVIVAK